MHRTFPHGLIYRRSNHDSPFWFTSFWFPSQLAFPGARLTPLMPFTTSSLTSCLYQFPTIDMSHSQFGHTCDGCGSRLQPTAGACKLCLGFATKPCPMTERSPFIRPLAMEPERRQKRIVGIFNMASNPKSMALPTIHVLFFISYPSESGRSHSSTFQAC